MELQPYTQTILYEQPLSPPCIRQELTGRRLREEYLKHIICEPSSEQRRSCSAALQQDVGLVENVIPSAEIDSPGYLLPCDPPVSQVMPRDIPDNQTVSLTENSILGVPELTSHGMNFAFTGGNINNQTNKPLKKLH